MVEMVRFVDISFAPRCRCAEIFWIYGRRFYMWKPVCAY